MVAIGYRDAAHAGRVCGFNIVDVVANHQRLADVDPQSSDGFQQRRRMRFSVLQAVAADDHREELGQRQRLEDLFRREERLVGHDGQAKAFAPQRIEGFEHAGIAPGQIQLEFAW